MNQRRQVLTVSPVETPVKTPVEKFLVNTPTPLHTNMPDVNKNKRTQYYLPSTPEAELNVGKFPVNSEGGLAKHTQTFMLK